MENLQPYNFIFELPLYTEIEITEQNRGHFFDLLRFSGKLDAYNPSLKQESSFLIRPPEFYIRNNSLHNYLGFHEYEARCVRNEYRIKVFAHLYEVEDTNDDEQTKYIYLKVGQSPSIAELHISKVRNYDKVLDREKIREITRSIGLAANGVGIGSFVYLRRVFEHLISAAHSLAAKDDGWVEQKYLESRMIEKIQLLRNHLPEFLVRNRNMYGILSLGIHELTEQECLSHFEALKVGIELILDEKLETLNKEKKLREAEQKLKSIEQSMKK